jgi:toxin ParE1/3/4
MVVRLVWSPEARKDLLDIYIVIGLENPAAAERLHDRIEAKAKAEALSHHPRLGPRRPDIQSRARVLVEGPYLILYEAHPDTDDGPVDWVEIVRVVDGPRDLPNVI